jgi:hypothetical protein
MTIKAIYPFQKACLNFRSWWKRNSAKDENNRTPNPKDSDVKVWWSKKARPTFLDVDFKAVATAYRRKENELKRRVQKLIRLFKKWFVRQQKKDQKGKLMKPTVADMHTWWSKRLAPGKKPDIENLFKEYLLEQKEAKLLRRLKSLRIWWAYKNQDPKKKPTIYDMKAWWSDELKAQKKDINAPLPNFYFLYKKFMKKLEFLELVAGVSTWWSKYGRRNIYKRLLKPKVSEVKNWFGKRTVKVSMKKLRNKYWQMRKRHYRKMRRFAVKFIAFWEKQNKGTYPVEQDVKNWYLSLRKSSIIQPNFTKLLNKILKVMEVKRNRRLAKSFLKWWKTSAPFERKVIRKGRRTSRILVRRSTSSIYDLKAWWTQTSAKKKNAVAPDFNKVWIRVQLLLARRTRLSQQSRFKRWWATYCLKKFKGKKARSMKKRPTSKYVKWWMKMMKIRKMNIQRWLKRFRHAEKKRRIAKKCKKASRGFAKWVKKQTVKKVMTVYDLKTWWAQKKAKKPYLKRPVFSKLFVCYKKHKKVGKCVKAFKKFLKARVTRSRPSKKYFMKWWNSHKKAKVNRRCVNIVSRKIAARKFRLLLKAFHKWWRAEMRKRNSPKYTDATVADAKAWWATRKIKNPQPNFWRLVAVYNRKMNLKRNIRQFIRYWKRTGITRRPFVYDLRAWWRRIMKQTRLRRPHFGVMLRHVLAKLAARSFKLGWEIQKKNTFPTKAEVASWMRTTGKSWRAGLKLTYKYVRIMFLLEKRVFPQRMLRLYPELRTVHRELIKMHMQKADEHQFIVSHREQTRLAYVHAIADLKDKQHQFEIDKKALKVQLLRVNFQRPKTQKANRQYQIARNNLQKSFYEYNSARNLFEKTKKGYFSGTSSRRKEYYSLEGKLKAIRLLIGLVGPQHHIRVVRKCETKRITRRCTQQICCNVRYLADLEGQRNLGKEYCQLQGSASCK